MATIRAKLKQLRDADVRYISLVDRAATRIPFRVLKRDKESKMGIDLTTVFKSDAAGNPHISALVVFAQKDEAAGTQVQDAIKKYGFTTERVQKSDEGETLVYAQQDQQGETQVIRLSDQLLVTVGGLEVPSGWIGEMVEKHGFYPDLPMATAEMETRLLDTVSKTEAPQADAEAILTSYAEYMAQLSMLPANCFKLDEVIRGIVAKCSCEAEVVDKKEGDEDEEAAESAEEEAKEDKKDKAKKADSPYNETTLHSDKVKNGAKKTGETEAEKKKRYKDHPPAETGPKDEDDDQKGPPEAYKSEVLKALKGVTEQLTGLSQKLETVVTEQASQKKTLDDVVQKADTLGDKVNATVLASPVSEDRPSPARMRVQKDDDPRTGNFDTAYLRRRR